MERSPDLLLLLCGRYILGSRKYRFDWRDVRRAFNPSTAKLFNLNFHPLEVVSRLLIGVTFYL